MRQIHQRQKLHKTKERIRKELYESKEGRQQQSFSEYDQQPSKPKAKRKGWEDGPEQNCTEEKKISGRGEIDIENEENGRIKEDCQSHQMNGFEDSRRIARDNQSLQLNSLEETRRIARAFRWTALRNQGGLPEITKAFSWTAWPRGKKEDSQR